MYILSFSIRINLKLLLKLSVLIEYIIYKECFKLLIMKYHLIVITSNNITFIVII